LFNTRKPDANASGFFIGTAKGFNTPNYRDASKLKIRFQAMPVGLPFSADRLALR